TWHIIEKWAPDGNGNLRKKYSYYHIYKTGLCWFTPYEYSKTRRKHRTAVDDFDDEYLPVPDRDYSFELVHLNLAVPFRAGDIVRIDCAPFAPPVNALILYSGEDWDCCGVLALYYKNGEYRAGAVKHCDMWLDLMPGVLVSPLFRLRKFTGRLTGNDAVFEEISKIINGSNAIGDKILELNQSGIIRTPEALLAAVQNIQD
ncbi:MAG: hypothetical protein IKH13_02565, partial [Clostridia bacterium]|nr:hypothetical protein [Clostridia bacterium]